MSFSKALPERSGEQRERGGLEFGWAWNRVISWTDRHPRETVALILLLALTLGTARLRADPLTFHSGETSHWWPLVLNVAHGVGYVACFPKYFPFCGTTNEITAAREPLPVFLFAAVARLTNDSWLAVGLVQIVINLAILVGLFFLARELANQRVALLAALMWSVYLPAMFYAAQVSGDLMATLLLTGGLFFFLHARVTGRTRDWLAAGLSVGLGALSRTAIMFVAPVLAIGLILWNPSSCGIARSLGHRLRPPALFTLAFGLALLPWLARNYAAFGRVVLGTTLTGYNLYRENYLLATPNYLRYVDADEAERAVEALLARRPELRGTENEAQMDLIYREEALRIITAEPLRYGLLSAYRSLMLWFNWGVKEDHSTYTALDYLMMLQQGLLLAAAGLGLGRMWRRGAPLIATVVTVGLLYMAVIGRMYLIVPVVPLMMPFSALGCALVAQRLA